MKRTDLLLVLGITLLGSGMRLFRLDLLGLSGDEPFTAVIQGLSPAQVIQASGTTGYPPLYYLLMHFWGTWFGGSEVALRVPSLITGTALVALATLAGIDMFGRGAGVLAGLLVAAAPMLLHFSQEARVYSLLALLVLAATWCLWRAGRDGRPWLWAAYSGLIALALYCQYATVFVIPAHGLFCLLQRARHPDPLPRFVAAVAGAGLLFAPWLPHFLHGPRAVGLAAGISLESYWSTLVSFVSGETIAGLGLRDLLAGAVGLGLLALAGAMFVRRGCPLTTGVLLCTLGVPLALLLPISSYFSMPRHFSFLLPPFLLLAAWGVMSLRPVGLRALPILAVLVVLGLALPRFYAGERITAQRWRELIGQLNMLDSTTLILVAPSFYTWQLDYYYRGAAPVQALPAALDVATNTILGGDAITPERLAVYNGLLDSPQRVILVGAQRAVVDPGGQIEGWLRAQGWRLLAGTPLETAYPALEVREFVRQDAGRASGEIGR